MASTAAVHQALSETHVKQVRDNFAESAHKTADIKKCEGNPCLNNGTCVVASNSLNFTLHVETCSGLCVGYLFNEIVQRNFTWSLNSLIQC